MTCEKHNCKLEIRYVPSCIDSFDGLYCPQCEVEEAEERKANEYLLRLVREAEDLERTIRLRRPHDGVKGWENLERWWAGMLRNTIKNFF